MLTRNYGDFLELHEFALAAAGRHPGLLLVRMDSDRKRDMKPHQIVTAIRKLEDAGVAIASQAVVLNQWR
jgi:hypothetical protein